MIRTAIDLFSGIGGFSRAAEAKGIEVLCHVEIDQDCQEYLRTEWPGVPVYGDIKSFPAHEYAGADLVMGGPPCQPISCAGKRKGAEDDRWLWGEALSVVERVRPRWCLFENPPGIRNMGLDGILSHLEGLGYTTGTVDIPACAVNAPHIRQRYWIVANRKSERRKGWAEGVRGEQEESGGLFSSGPNLGHLADDEREGLEEPAGQRGDYGQEREATQRGAVGDVGHARREHGQRGPLREGPGASDPREWNQAEHPAIRASQWSSCHWTPCADGKVRRTPDAAFLLADECPVDVVAALAEEGWPKGAS